MIKMHDKLFKGEKFEQKDVSYMLLVGIMKILSQAREHNKNFRLESLESWSLKHGGTIKLLELLPLGKTIHDGEEEEFLEQKDVICAECTAFLKT